MLAFLFFRSACENVCIIIVGGKMKLKYVAVLNLSANLICKKNVYEKKKCVPKCGGDIWVTFYYKITRIAKCR